MPDNSSITFIDVGQGDATLITTSTGKKVLVDGGPGYNVDSLFELFYPFIRCPVDYMILTHPHADHLSGLNRILARCPNMIIFQNPVTYKSNLYESWMKIIKSHQVYNLIAGDKFYIDNIVFTVLWPPSLTKNFSNINDYSIVLFVEMGEFELLLLGDINGQFLRQLNSEVIDSLLYGKFDMVKLSHHGAINGFSSTFYNLFPPRIVVMSVGAANSYGHPSPDVVDYFTVTNSIIYRTDTAGTIRISVDR